MTTKLCVKHGATYTTRCELCTIEKRQRDNYYGTQAWKRLAATVRKRDMNRCVICGSSQKPIDVDHIVPRSQGGPDTINNLRSLCRRCHNKRLRTR